MKWGEVVDKIYVVEEEVDWREVKFVIGKCKLVMEKFEFLEEKDDFLGLIVEWVELLEF